MDKRAWPADACLTHSNPAYADSGRECNAQAILCFFNNAAERQTLHAMVSDSVDSDSALKAQIGSETSKIPWRELQRFFAQGATVRVSAELDLVDVAFAIARDHKASIEAWMGSGEVQKVSDDLAREWFAADRTVWAVVVKPWILVQDRDKTGA